MKKELDNVFSHYIRRRDKFTCFTCGKKGDISSMQNGHYVSRMHMSLRYSLINCNCQCVGCNVFKHGNMDVYALNLQRVYGADVLKELQRVKNTLTKFTRMDYEDLITKYKHL